jgi:hypothetical protein
MQENLEEWKDRLGSGVDTTANFELQRNVNARGKQDAQHKALAESLRKLWGDACLWDE